MTSILEKREAKRAELIRRLETLSPKHRMDSMLEEVDGRALVRSIPAVDVYGTIVDVGLADSTEIVQLSTPEQFQSYVDLAAWQKDRVDAIEILHWIRAARGDDDVAFMAKLRMLDIELLELMFRRLTRIHVIEEDPDVNLEGVVVETPDGKLLIEMVVEGVDEAAMRRLAFDLIAHNPFELSRFLEAVRWEMPSELEEAAYQFRQSRLQDLGFPTFEEAIKVFAPVQLKDFASFREQTVNTLMVTAESVDYVTHAFTGLDAVERDNLQMEVRHLVNSVIVGDGIEPGDPALVRQLSEETRDGLCLGLEWLTQGDTSRCSEAVRTYTLRQLFQIGHTLTLSLRKQAEQMVKMPHVRFAQTILALDEEAATVTALLRRRPKKALKVAGAAPVPFRSQRELTVAQATLDLTLEQSRVFHQLLGDSPQEMAGRFQLKLGELTPQRLFLAVVALAETDGVVDVNPFPSLQLAGLLERLFDNAKSVAVLRPTAGHRALDTLGAKLSASPQVLQPMIERVLNVLLHEVQSVWAQGKRVEAKMLQSLPMAGEVIY